MDQRLVNLEELWLPRGVTEVGLEHVQNLVKLRTFIPPKDITDRGLAYMAGMTQLEELDLQDRPISDEGLRHIGSMTGLRKLSVGSQWTILALGLPGRGALGNWKS